MNTPWLELVRGKPVPLPPGVLVPRLSIGATASASAEAWRVGTQSVRAYFQTHETWTIAASWPLPAGPSWTLDAPYALPEFGLDVVVIARPWDQPPDLQTWLEAPRRLLVSAVGEANGVWFDGPLVHIVNGAVASYLPAGGPASLGVPATVAPGLAGRALSSALATEGDAGERAYRCLGARVAAAFATWPDETLHLTTSTFDLRSALALVLARAARLDATIHLTPAEAPPPAWRRLSENTGIIMELPGKTRPSTAAAAPRPLALESLAALIEPQHSLACALAVNAGGDILPRRLLRG